MADSKIEWTDKTWNPTRGCDKISPGCKHCYAETFAERWRGVEGHAYELGFSPRLAPDKLVDPLKWKKPARIFVNSMSDLFHESFSNEYIAAVFGVMAASSQHTFQVLTKRAERMAHWFAWVASEAEDFNYSPLGWIAHVGWRHLNTDVRTRLGEEKHGTMGVVATIREGRSWPLKNVWLGVSVESQQYAEARIPHLLRTPATVRFLSVEPQLGPVDLMKWLRLSKFREGYESIVAKMPGGEKNMPEHLRWNGKEPPCLHWVIVGGESGPGARRFDVAWARKIVRHCQAAGVAVFVKQLGRFVVDRNDAGFDGVEDDAWDIDDDEDVEHDLDGTRDGYQGAPVRIHLRDKKGGDVAEWPRDLRVREFPR